VLEVHISSKQYLVGAVRSHMATPIVDEVVRLHPKTVLVHLCPGAAEKLHPFGIELAARARIKINVKFAQEGC